MKMPNYRNKARAVLACLALLLAGALALGGLLSPQGSEAAAPANGIAGAQTQPDQSPPPRRESAPAPEGPAPITGPASAFRPLDVPNFGPNYRANTDSQSLNYAQQEPSIGVNPLNPLNVVVAAKDERQGTNTKHVYIYTSTDGGVTWINQPFPYRLPAPGYSSDPVVNFTDDGVVYVTSLPYGGGTAGIQIARSTDGGITFPVVGQVTTNTGSDKEWTWIDTYPSSPYYHRMYVAWRNFGGGPAITVNYSTDRGATWTPDIGVALNAYQFPMPIVYPNGDVQVVHASSFFQFSYSRSTDGGATWGNQQPISSFSRANCPPDNPGCSIWRLNSIPAIAVNPNNGNAVFVWADGEDGTSIIRYTRSTDNGTTWSASQVLAPPGVANTYQVEPWVHADEQGIFHAIWYDDRENPNTSIFHIYYSQSTDNGQTWTQAVRISTASSDLRIGIPSGYGFAAGDYIQVAASGNNVYAAWTDTREGSGEDIYVVRGVMGGGTPTPTPPTTAVPTSTSTSTAIPPTSTRTPTVVHTATPQPTETHAATLTPGTPTTTPTACLLQFTDVPVTNTFYPFVRCLACKGIISGYPCGGTGEPCNANDDPYFRPNNPVTRGQIAKIVSLSAGQQTNIPPTWQAYEDVVYGSPFWLYIERLSGIGYINGYPCGSPGEPCVPPGNRPYFRPNAGATRGQIVKIASNSARFSDNIPPEQQTFTDVVSGIGEFWIYIERLLLHRPGAIQGYPCGGPGEPCDAQNRPYFRPNNGVTRGQASKIAANTFLPGCDPPRP